MNNSLGEICSYRSEKANASSIGSEDLYISTESMAPNKGGISTASSIPGTGRVSFFHQGDTLVSNIRPYFKKIWHADKNGYCSNDILVFQPNDASTSDYLYWLLSGDEFFDYVMATSKGTKMPRGDKSAIMNYAVPSNDETARRLIVSVMSPIQSKIEANTKLNGYLLEMATAQFERKLADERFEFRLSELVELEDSKRVPLNSRDRENRKGPYPYYGATSVMDYVDDYLFDGIRVLLGEDGTVIREDGRPVLQYVWGKYWVNNHAHILKAKMDYSLEAIYIALARTAINHIVTGAVQMKISQKNLNGLELELPSRESLDYLKGVFSLYRNNVEESKRLERLRDTLLPKLMSGEIDVSKVDLTQQNSHLAAYRPPCRGLRSSVLPGLVANLLCVWLESGQQSRFRALDARS